MEYNNKNSILYLMSHLLRGIINKKWKTYHDKSENYKIRYKLYLFCKVTKIILDLFFIVENEYNKM